MIIKESVLSCIDNTGATKIRCIDFLDNTGRGFVTIGCIIKIVIHRCVLKKIKGHLSARDSNRLSLNLKSTYLAVIISTNVKLRRAGNFFFKTHKNRALLLNKKLEIYGTRIRGFTVKEFIKSPFFEERNKILLTSTYIM